MENRVDTNTSIFQDPPFLGFGLIGLPWFLDAGRDTAVAFSNSSESLQAVSGISKAIAVIAVVGGIIYLVKKFD